eukprot:5700240-Prymnesium_polylepis.1
MPHLLSASATSGLRADGLISHGCHVGSGQPKSTACTSGGAVRPACAPPRARVLGSGASAPHRMVCGLPSPTDAYGIW